MFRTFAVCLVLMPVLAASAQIAPTEAQQAQIANPSCSNISLGVNGALNGFVPSPNDQWHQDVSNAPVSSYSNLFLNTSTTDLAGTFIHPDFGTTAGIPYNVVDSLSTASQYPQTLVPMTLYPSSSDLTYYPVGTGLAIEGNPGNCPTDGNDRHLLVIDRRSCTNYELDQAADCNGSFTADNGVLFDLLTTEQRPYGLTSADASGQSIFEGLIRYDEILAGVINHAIRFTVPRTRSDANGGLFVNPATHAAGNSSSDIPMGTRLRLNPNFNISGFSATNQIILTAMKKYGLILADNGSAIYIQGTTDSRWNDSDLHNLQNVLSSDLQVITYGVTAAYDAADAPSGAAPTITNFVATPGVYNGVKFYTLSANVTGGTYSYMNYPGLETGAIFRGYMAVAPTTTTTYTLTSRNLYGTTQASVTVHP
jgi:hypothetical protein